MDTETLKQFALMEFVKGENLDAVAGHCESLAHDEIEDVIRDEIRALSNNNQQAIQWVADRDAELAALREVLAEIEWHPSSHYFDGVPEFVSTRIKHRQYQRLMELTKRNEQ